MCIRDRLHGDVYCGARAYRFGLTDSDRCIRCFGEETIKHLLYECPYSVEIWNRYGLFPVSANQVLDSQLSHSQMEIMAELISALVFRKKVLPPEVVLHSVITSFKKGLSTNSRTTEYAAALVTRHEFTGQWFT